MSTTLRATFAALAPTLPPLAQSLFLGRLADLEAALAADRRAGRSFVPVHSSGAVGAGAQIGTAPAPEAPMSPARERELLAGSAVGRAVLRERDRTDPGPIEPEIRGYLAQTGLGRSVLKQHGYAVP